MDSSAKIISYDEFVETYLPIDNVIVEGEKERQMFAVYGNDLRTVLEADHNHVWTVIDVDLSNYENHPYDGESVDNCWLIVPGYHWVNRLYYVITEKPWPCEDIEVPY